MKYNLKCLSCGATCWASGDDEPDTNACTIDDYDLEWFGGKEGCEHDDWEIVDSEYPEPIDG